jgi:hypothetical protein
MRCSGVAIVVWLGLGGCLPEGGPGVGRQVVAERGLADVTFSRERTDGPGGYLLFTRPSATTGAAADELARDLYLVARDGGETRLRAERLPAQVRSIYFWDSGGRLYLHRDVQRRASPRRDVPAEVSYELIELEPVMGQQTSFGRSRLERMSPSRSRMFYQRPDGAGLLRELPQGTERPAGAAIRQSMFIGEDLFLVESNRLSRLAAGQEAPEVLLPRVTAFRPVKTPEGQLVVRRPNADTRDETLALVQLTADGTLASELTRTRPIGDPFVSPDGGRVAWASAGDPPEMVSMSVHDLSSGRLSRVGSFPTVDWKTATGEPRLPDVEILYRPGSTDVWFSLDATLTIVRATGLESVVRPVIIGNRIGPGRSSDRLADDQPSFSRRARPAVFTADGLRWIFEGGDGRTYLGNADAPQLGDGIAVSTIGSSPDLLELGSGRRLAVWLTPGIDRADLHLLDLERGELRFLAQDVGATLFGAHRVLAIARKLGDRRATGDLVLVDLDTGTETLLAHNVSEFAVPPCAGCDVTRAGAPFAYVVQARVPWRYEGLWTGELP